MLVKQRKALEEFLDVSPTALSNLQLAYNPSTGTLDTRDNGPGPGRAEPAHGHLQPASASCRTPTPLAPQCTELVEGGGGLPLPLPGAGGRHGARADGPRSAPPAT